MKDLVVGVASGFSWAQIEPWAVSLNRAGCSAQRVIVLDETCPNLTESTLKLTAKGFHVLNAGIPRPECRSPLDEQYRYLTAFLEHGDFDLIVLANTRDLIFQSDPITWLREHLHPNKDVLVVTEGMKFQDQPWSLGYMLQAFGTDAQNRTREQEIWNSGMIAGRGAALKNIFQEISCLCESGGHPTSDQAALNLLLSQEPWLACTQGCYPSSGFIVHLAAMASHMGLIRFMKQENMTFEDGVVYINGSPVCMVHQYDRIREWFPTIDMKYREEQHAAS